MRGRWQIPERRGDRPPELIRLKWGRRLTPSTPHGVMGALLLLTLPVLLVRKRNREGEKEHPQEVDPALDDITDEMHPRPGGAGGAFV